MALLDSISNANGLYYFPDPRDSPKYLQNGVPINDPPGPGALSAYGPPPGLDRQGPKPIDAKGPGSLVAPAVSLLKEHGIGDKIDLYG